VVAPETAAHAAGTSALLPMLTLGIPGSPTAAVLLGGLLIWGLQPGPLLFVEQKDFVWGLIASMYLGNLVGLFVVLTTVPWWAAILRIPFPVIAPVIIVICAIGAYTVHSSIFDVIMMLVFGVLGYLFKKLRYPMAPLVLALVLGDMAESSFRQSMLLSQGDVSIFFGNWLVGSLMALPSSCCCCRPGASSRTCCAGAKPRRIWDRTNDMKIAIVGAGAIGGFLGARLALAGEEVTCIARGPNLAAIQANGLKLIEEDGTERHAPTVKGAQKMADAGVQDVVLLTLKAHQVKDVLPDMRALFGPDTVVVTMQNGIPWWYFHKLAGPWEGRAVDSVDPGIGSGEHRSRTRDRQRGLSGLRTGRAGRDQGRSRATASHWANSTAAKSPRLEALAQTLIRAGFKAPVIDRHPFRDLAQAVGQPQLQPDQRADPRHAGGHLPVPADARTRGNMMREAQTVAEKLGVRFKVSLDKRIAGAEAVGKHKTSMLQDVESGRPLELEALVGSVRELGRVTETPTPTIDAIYACASLLAKTLGEQNGKLALLRADSKSRRW
jgi:2-dehydropantoate 2-reductase